LDNPSLSVRWRTSMAQFLAIELYTANMFATFALAPRSLENRARYVQNARQAFDTVVQFALRAALNETEVARVTEELGSVRSRLEGLGEGDLGEVSVLDSFASALAAGKSAPQLPNEASQQPLTVEALGREAHRFEMQCHQLVTDCRDMLAQNQALMKRNSGPDT